MQSLPDLVRLSRLNARFSSDPEYTEHSRDVLASPLERRLIRKEERWKKEKLLGCGSFGDVWLQECIYGDSKGKARAVKQMRKLQNTNYDGELEATAFFSHHEFERCFVKSFGWYEDSTNIFMTMEYFPNGDLQRYIGSPLPENETQTIVSQILEGLDYMHQNKFTHRDLKPANILVVYKKPDWWVKIADFGITKRVREEHSALRTLTGTPAFAAPEILNVSESDSYTDAVDVWSLGAITFFLLTGELPFRDRSRLNQYVKGTFAFPFDCLSRNAVSWHGGQFTRILMAPKARERPSAKEASQDIWLANLDGQIPAQTRRSIGMSATLEIRNHHNLPTKASASWSTQEGTTINPIESDKARKSTHAKKNNESTQVSPLEAAEPLNRLGDTAMKKKDYVRAVKYYTDALTIIPGHMIFLLNRAAALQDLGDFAGACIDAEAAIKALPGSAKAWYQLGLARFSNGDIQGSMSAYLKAITPEDREVADFARTGLEAAIERSKQGYRKKSTSNVGKNDHHQSLKTSFLTSQSTKNPSVPRSETKKSTIEARDRPQLGVPAILEGHSKGVKSLAFSPDGRKIVSGSVDRTVRLWDLCSGQKTVLKLHSDEVTEVAFSPDGKQIASISLDLSIRLWRLGSEESGLILDCQSKTMRHLRYSPNNKVILAVTIDRSIKLWNTTTGAPGATIRLPGTPKKLLASHLIRPAEFSPDGLQIVSAAGQTVRLWDSYTGVPGHVLQGHLLEVMAVKFSPDGEQIASASLDRTIRLWNSRLGTPITVFRGHSSGVYLASFSPDGTQLVSKSYDGAISLWECSTGTSTTLLRIRYHKTFVTPNGKRIVAVLADGKTMRTWDTATEEDVVTLRGHTQRISSKIACSPTGTLVASASEDGVIRLWDPTGKQSASI